MQRIILTYPPFPNSYPPENIQVNLSNQKICEELIVLKVTIAVYKRMYGYFMRHEYIYRMVGEMIL